MCNTLQEDAIHNLGFVSCSKRFNVAVTRAKAALVIFGNPILLMEDESWRQLILYCLEKNAYVGANINL